MDKRLIRDICTIKPPKSEARQLLTSSDIVSFVPMEDLGIQQKTFEPKKERKFSEVAGSYTYFADNDVLLAKITPCFENGKLGVARELKNGVGFGSSEFLVLRPNSQVDSDYLYYFLSQEDIREEGSKLMTGAVGHKRVPPDFIADLKIAVPSRADQRRIVKILDEAFEHIAKAKANIEKNLQNAREVFESYLNSLITRDGALRKLDEIVADDCTLSYGIVQPGKDKEGGLPIVRPMDLSSSVVGLNTLKRIDPRFASGYSRTRLNGGELLLCVRGTTGAMAIADGSLAGSNVTRGIVPIRFMSEIVLSRFGYYAFMSGFVQQQIQKNTYGTALTQINIRDLRKLDIPVPAFEAQGIIAERLDTAFDAARSMESAYDHKLATLDALKKSLLRQAFNGEL